MKNSGYTTSEQPLMSVIVTTKNNTATLEACLESIRQQSYQNVELIVVDNFSTDDTTTIAKQFTPHVFQKGPERSPQRNYGVSQAKGTYVLIIDSDMELGLEVVAQCIEKFQSDPGITGVIIPEESFGTSYWAKVKALERSFYVGVDYMEAARSYPKALFDSLGGYDISMVSGEDWDFSQRAGNLGHLAHIQSYIRHNEGHLQLGSTLRKKYYYAQKFAGYMAQNKGTEQANHQTSPFNRYRLFLSQPKRLFKNPMLGASVLFMKTAEFAMGAIGYARTGLALNIKYFSKPNS